MKNKIQFFPITIFSIVMGLSGLTIAFGKFYHLQWLPKILYEIMLFTILTLFILFGILYLLKAVYFLEEVKKDFQHRIRINFFSAISISLLLLSIAYYTYFPISGIALWWLGIILHTWFMYKTLTFWIQHNFEMHHFNPAWFIPVVGNILIPVVGVDLVPVIIPAFYFASGLFFWIVLFTIFLYRAVFHAQLPEKFVPTFFILLAPPAVGFISYIRITTSWDFLSISLLLLAYFFVGVLIFLNQSFMRLKYYLSWWAFTFPLTAITIASVVAYQITSQSIYKHLSWIFLSSAIVVISIVAWVTIEHIRKGEICVNEECFLITNNEN
ncbi:MAG: SLAC1 anion channel family protein [bacterium]